MDGSFQPAAPSNSRNFRSIRDTKLAQIRIGPVSSRNGTRCRRSPGLARTQVWTCQRCHEIGPVRDLTKERRTYDVERLCGVDRRSWRFSSPRSRIFAASQSTCGCNACGSGRTMARAGRIEVQRLCLLKSIDGTPAKATASGSEALMTLPPVWCHHGWERTYFVTVPRAHETCSPAERHRDQSIGSRCLRCRSVDHNWTKPAQLLRRILGAVATCLL
jgi:hypothetical protein